MKRKGPIRMIGPRRDNDVIAGIDGYGKLPLLGRNGASIDEDAEARSRHRGRDVDREPLEFWLEGFGASARDPRRGCR